MCWDLEETIMIPFFNIAVRKRENSPKLRVSREVEKVEDVISRVAVVDQLEINQNGSVDFTVLVILKHDIVGPEVPMTAGIDGCDHIPHEPVELLPCSHIKKLSNIWYEVLPTFQLQYLLCSFSSPIK